MSISESAPLIARVVEIGLTLNCRYHQMNDFLLELIAKMGVRWRWVIWDERNARMGGEGDDKLVSWYGKGTARRGRWDG